MNKKIFLFFDYFTYFTFIIFDLLDLNTTLIKYLSIFFCFIFALTNNKKYLIISSFFTLIADLFLLVLNSHYEIGVSSFIVVQIVYLYFLGNLDIANYKRFLILRLILIILCLLILFVTNNLTILYILVVIYFSNLLISTIESFFTNNTFLKLGLLLFVCCDICVGLHNINVAYDFATLFMWIFYLPSQVLIVLS